MARPKPDIALVQVLLRLHPDTIAMIDARRGELSRPQWIAGLVNVTLAAQLTPMSDAEVHRVIKAIPSPKAAPQKPLASALPPRGGKLTLDDVRPKFEPRFKKPKGGSA